MSAPTDQTPPTSEDNDEISLYDIWQTLKAGWRWIVGGLVAGLIAAAGHLAVTLPQYEAMALLQIGQIESIGQVGQVGQVWQAGVTPIEAPARVVERIMFPTFKEVMVRKLGWSGDARGAVYVSSLSAKPAKALDLIELRVRGLSREDAASSLAATIEYLATVHKEIAQPAIESLKLELKATSDELEQTSKILANLAHAAQLQKQLPPRDRFNESILYAQLFATSGVRERDLRRREAQYRDWISMSGRAATATFAEPSVPQEPVSPKKQQTLMLGALGGAFLGGVLMLFRRGWPRWVMARKPLANE